jgi:hypothetical protein
MAKMLADIHGHVQPVVGRMDAIEQSQSRLISTFTQYLKRIEEKIDKLSPAPPGSSVNTDALAEATAKNEAATSDLDKSMREGKT